MKSKAELSTPVHPRCSAVYRAPSLEGLLTIKQAADIAGVTPQHVKSWVDGGWLAAYRPFGSEMVVLHPSDFQRFCKEYEDQL